MATSIEICNAALSMLGDKPIASFEDVTDRAKLCANTYGLMRRTLLRLHPWNCATKRVILAPEANTPAFDWAYQFALPAKWLRTLQVGYDGAPMDYAFESNRILANSPALPMVYLAEVDEDQWDSLLTDVAIAYMTMTLAYPITKSASKSTELKQEFYSSGGILARAKTADGQENPPMSWNDSVFISVRG
jgi:hypothetical protein